MKQVHGACPHDCPDTCAWQVTVDDDGRAVQLQGTANHHCLIDQAIASWRTQLATFEG